MTLRLSVPVHGALELLLGLAVLVASFTLGAPGLVVGVPAGMVIAGLGLAGAELLPLRTHLTLDRAIAAVLLAGALVNAVIGRPGATLLLGAAALAELALLSTTRWTAS